ncbi:centrin [Trypanosoma conorhini]|uniref:Centrin n=1 Tax=Trypanosoma conorhini TaxID=83891 RepID=A0A3S5ISJ2_9TRYP|nr:centrin [Trypanosoma conorhini]RNF11592.1 centrin [Trypanosoma conorhini]
MESSRTKSVAKGPAAEKPELKTPLSISMSERHKAQLREAFDLFDSEGTGRIKALDVKVALCALGYDVSKDELAQLLRQVGGSIVAGVDFNEFYCVLLAKMAQRESRSEAIRAFKLIDVGEKGHISVDDLRPIADSLDMDLTDDELAEMVLFAHPSIAFGKNEAEIKEPLTVSEEEFLKLMARAHVY